MSHLSYTKNFTGLGDIFFRNPKRYLPLVQLLDTLMSADSDLTHSHREAIALYSSVLNGCQYCVNSHSAVLGSLQENPATILNITNGSLEKLDPQLNAILLFTKKLTLNPDKINARDTDTVRAAGWSDQAIEDAIGVISLFSMINRIVDAIGLPGSTEHYQQFSNMVSQEGYSPLVKMIKQKL